LLGKIVRICEFVCCEQSRTKTPSILPTIRQVVAARYSDTRSSCSARRSPICTPNEPRFSTFNLNGIGLPWSSTTLLNQNAPSLTSTDCHQSVGRVHRAHCLGLRTG